MRKVLAISFAILVVFIGCKKEQPPSGVTPSVASDPLARPLPEMAELDAKIFKTNFAEELILELTPRLKLLAEKFKGKPPKVEAFDPPVIIPYDQL